MTESRSPLKSALEHWLRPAAMVVGVAALAALWAWSFLAPLDSILLERQERHLTAFARSAITLLQTVPGDPTDQLYNLVDQTGFRIEVTNAQGEVVFDSIPGQNLAPDASADAEIEAALAGRTGRAQRIDRLDGEKRAFLALPTGLDAERAVVRVSEDQGYFGDILMSAVRSGLVLLTILLILAIILARRLDRGIAQPISRLTSAAQKIASGNLQVVIGREGGSFEPMAIALEALKERIRSIEEAHLGEKQDLRRALDGFDDAVLLVDAGVIQYANSSAGRLLGAPVSTLVGRTIDGVDLPASIGAGIGALVDERVVIESGPDPSGTTLRATVTPLDAESGSGGALVVIGDVTERLKTERLRRDFVANASHELKTPVSTIRLLAESTRDAALDGDVEQSLAFATQIADESHRLSRLVVDLLDLSRLESTDSAGSSSDVREGIANAVLSHRTAAAHKSLTLQVDDTAVEGEDLYAAVNLTDLAIVLDNLLDNAVNYTAEGGARVLLEADVDTITISVIDTGIGIPAEDLSRIFERFYRVDRARSRSTGSTGLGLSLVRNVVERSGGSVEVASSLGHGSTFVVRLPRAR
ncbi:MAG: ATP-binding protein [Actinobacteria bacterium]|nr:ATP-binding protein [Actinomycetota bacterium]MCL5887114.1 ATP-binding protein [Actinomycetota bacterium]